MYTLEHNESLYFLPEMYKRSVLLSTGEALLADLCFCFPNSLVHVSKITSTHLSPNRSLNQMHFLKEIILASHQYTRMNLAHWVFSVYAVLCVCFFFLTLHNCISFAKYQNESTTGSLICFSCGNAFPGIGLDSK